VRAVALRYQTMKVLLGLGNPGKDYERTRHNIGWWVLDACARRWMAEGWKKDGQAMVATARVGSTVVKLVKPLTYMNLSGQVLTPYLRRDSFDAAQDLMVIVDEVALPFAQLRTRASGSAGGHNGLKSVQSVVGGSGYPRMRVGIQPLHPRASVGDLSDFVLAPFTRDETTAMESSLPRMVDALELWVREGLAPMMNKYNRVESGDAA
jgi:peptidyl-tRNA hydrolase, PTH1 family